MEPASHEMNLSAELTCSICTEILYQPLTLLDCLHTFCGACIQPWFTHERNLHPTHHNPYTCPSCRAQVRATKHDARCHSLLEMFLAAHPDKRKSATERAEWERKYKPGDVVLQPIDAKTPSSRSRRRQEEDRQLVDEVRALSLRTSVDERPASSRRDRRYVGASLDPSTSGIEIAAGTEGRASRRRSSRSHSYHDDASRQHEETAARVSREIEHQSSLRSMISSDGDAALDTLPGTAMQDEILRQIQEEGLLEGIDIHDATPEQHEEIGHRIAEAYLRRHRRAGSGNVPSIIYSSETPRSNGQTTSERQGPRSTRPEGHSRSASLVELSSNGSQQPPRRSTEHERRRATSSTGRPTSPTASTNPRQSNASVHVMENDSQGRTSRPPVPPRTRRSVATASSDGGRSVPKTRASAPDIHSSESQPAIVVAAPTSPEDQRASPPNLSAIVTSIPRTSIGDYENDQMSDANLMPAPLSPHRSPSISALDRANAFGSASRPASFLGPSSPRVSLQRFPEPNITCSRCAKPHIEYDLHYNCSICALGNWNICRDCHFSPVVASCHHWFGFGHSAWLRWEAQAAAEKLPHGDLEQPHRLTSNRYRPPKPTEGGAQGRRTITTEDPDQRLESGCFCDNCLAWSNACYWKCDICNDSEWGFCNNCVETGKSCTHPLLPLAYVPTDSIPSPPIPDIPVDAHILSSPTNLSMGAFKTLTFHSLCSFCETIIPPEAARYHCPICPAPANNFCIDCYQKYHVSRIISPENGLQGWYRDLDGHRMQLVAFSLSPIDQCYRRVVVQDLIGGTRLKSRACDENENLEIWEWKDEDGTKRMKHVTKDVGAFSPTSPSNSQTFPPPSGAGLILTARYGWFPPRLVPQPYQESQFEEQSDSFLTSNEADEVEDRSTELLFPRSAEIRECEDLNGDWWIGVYMGKEGLFPAGYAL